MAARRLWMPQNLCPVMWYCSQQGGRVQAEERETPLQKRLAQLAKYPGIGAHSVDASSAGYLDIFSCKYYRSEDALTFCKDFFEAKDAKYNYLLRV